MTTHHSYYGQIGIKAMKTDTLFSSTSQYNSLINLHVIMSQNDKGLVN